MRRLHFYHVGLFGVGLIFLLLRHFPPALCFVNRFLPQCLSSQLNWDWWQHLSRVIPNQCTQLLRRCVFLLPHSEWYLNGNYLVVIVSIAVILPLALMKQLGEYERHQALWIIRIRLSVSVLFELRNTHYFTFHSCKITLRLILNCSPLA